MAATVFTSTVANALKLTLNEIVNDKTDGYESKLVMKKWLEESPMDDNYIDDLEMGGPGLATEKSEGTEISLGTIQQGVLTRYISRTFALKLAITEEAIEDRKYPQVIDAARRLKRAMYKTIDIDATNILVRGFNTSYVGGDGLPLWSASHTLPAGGTFSNLMATAMSPSRIAVITATSQIRKFPGHDGVIEGAEPKCIACPMEQWGVWAGITGSERAPEPGAFNEINVVKTMLGLEVVPIKYWTNTTTNWAIITDADNGLKFLWRRRPRNRSWVDNDQEIMKYSISARWARGWSDPRCSLGVNA